MNLKKLSIIGIIIGTILVLCSSILLILNKKQKISLPEDEFVSSEDVIVAAEENDEAFPVNMELEEIEERRTEIYHLQESGWIPNWAFDLGFESLENNREIIDTVNPVLYSVDKAGNVVGRGV